MSKSDKILLIVIYGTMAIAFAVSVVVVRLFNS